MAEEVQDYPRDVTPAEKPMTPLQRKALAARGDLPEEPETGPDEPEIEQEAPPVDDAEIVDGHWTDAVDTGPAAPMDEGFDEGTVYRQGRDEADHAPL
ncbi:hypothetical protein P7F88_25390 [Vibrio hannami]|uniref:hypothetical protein n=1 Tax=Vibrio hannami TaxID=2717094 RepID=UPI00240FD2F6|nr:hypothetical protein [Vibrio hannami]MDG3089200.1 hypothetical protein [Vibrio hannami]